MGTPEGIQLNATQASDGKLVVSLTPGQSTQFSVKDVGTVPAQIVTRTQTITDTGAGCAYGRSPGKVVVVTPVSFTLQPGESHAVSVVAASSGPAGTHDLSIQAADTSAAQVVGGARLLQVVAADVVVKYPGKPAVVQKVNCVTHPTKIVHNAAPPIRTVSTGISPLLIGGLGALVLALVIIIAVMFRKRHHTS